MKIHGTLTKSGKFWLVHMPLLDAHTQGTSRSNALLMAADWIVSMADTPKLTAKATLTSKSTFEVACNDTAAFMALVLKQQRQAHHLSLREVAKRLGQTSPNAYARFESKKAKLSIEKFSQLLGVVGVKAQVHLELR